MPSPHERPSLALDSLDRRIIDELQHDGRRPYTEIARTLGVSEATVRKRVARLMRTGGFQIVASVDAHVFGYVKAEVGLRVRGPSLYKVTERLNSVPEVNYVELLLGPYDMLISLTCRDNQHLLAVLNDVVRTIPGVEIAEASTVLEVTKDIYYWSAELQE
jgi:Lrp/AsnC family transcriptional regulator for asnA, asnC and gidA